MQRYYENWKKTADAKMKLKSRIMDPEGILTGNGYIEGVYEFTYCNVKSKAEFSAYIGQAGCDPAAPDWFASNIYERVLQHLKRWLGGNYFTYWTGIAEDDTDWKIKIKLLCEEKDHAARFLKESHYIEDHHPLLQDPQDGKYELYPSGYYNRNDLCIHPWHLQRRRAFLDKISRLRGRA